MTSTYTGTEIAVKLYMSQQRVGVVSRRLFTSIFTTNGRDAPTGIVFCATTVSADGEKTLGYKVSQSIVLSCILKGEDGKRGGW